MQPAMACFPRYTPHDPSVPVWCITPNEGGTIHRFFDTSPFSPSGRYVGLTRFPFEDHVPLPGDPARIVVVDLAEGTERVVAETRGWDTQLGAQVQWGATDAQLLFNDMDTDTWRPFGVCLDPATGDRRELDGTVYMASLDGRYAVSPCLLRTGATQAGYGVIAPREHVPLNQGAPKDDGIFVTDTATGECHMVASLARIVAEATPRLDPEVYRGGTFYAFHTKFNPQGTRLMLVLRWLPNDGQQRMHPNVITMSPDGSDIHVAIPASRWVLGGHHPNWCPDGDTVMMNLEMPGEGLRFVSANYDGDDFRLMHPTLIGSGHPALHPDGRHIVTDAYPGEPVAYGDGSVPIRLIDLESGQDDAIVRIHIVPPETGPRNELRVDPHPAWNRRYQRVAFNGCPDGTRRVYVADLSGRVPAVD